MLQSPNFILGKLFSEAWNKEATVGNAVRGFECTGMFPLKPSAIPDDKFLTPQYFKQDSTDSLPPDTLDKSPVSSPETPKPSGSSFLQSTSYLSVAGPSRTTQERTDTVKKNVLSTIIPTPEKKQSWKKRRKRQETRHLTSDSNFEETLVERRLKMEKEHNEKCVPKTKLRRAPRGKQVIMTFFQSLPKIVMKTRLVDSAA
jgi:hypothetical protein